MKKLAIFAIFLFVGTSCHEATIEKCHCFVTISDALPIQFWLTGCASYNTSNKCGVHDACFCQPVECDDEINIQFTDDSDDDYILAVYDGDGNELFSDIFIKDSDIEPSPSLESLSGFSNHSTGESWNTGANPTSDPIDNGQFTKILLGEISNGYTGVEYSFDIDLDITKSVPGGGSFNVTPTFYIYNSDFSQVLELDLQGQGDGGIGNNVWLLSPNTVNNRTCTIVGTPSFVPSYFGMRFEQTGGLISPAIIDINSTSMSDNFAPSVSRTIYQYSFTPSNHGICDEKIQLKILRDASPDEEVAYTDCIDVKTDHGCTTLIEYYNARNFAGIVYEDESPDQTFSVRVPSVFFHERFPEEDEDIELPSSLLSLNSSLKAQRLLDTAYMPYFMHRKIMLVLKHQFITIDGTEWVKEEPYEIQEGDRRWPLKKAKCYLSEKNYVQRNVL